jgi:hypothetical protein
VLSDFTHKILGILMKKDVAKIMFIVMILSSIFVSSAYADVDESRRNGSKYLDYRIKI